jgi:uncharacterized protein (DUF849 family)
MYYFAEQGKRSEQQTGSSVPVTPEQVAIAVETASKASRSGSSVSMPPGSTAKDTP